MRLTRNDQVALAEILLGSLERRDRRWVSTHRELVIRRDTVQRLIERGLVIELPMNPVRVTPDNLSLYGRREARAACHMFGLDIPEAVE